MAIGTPTIILSNSSTSNPSVLTTTVDAPAGSFLFFTIGAYRSNLTRILSITDSNGNVYAGGQSVPTGVPTSFSWFQLFWATTASDLPAGSTVTVTFTSAPSGVFNPLFLFFSITGISANPFVTQGSTDANSSGSTTSLATGTLPTASEICFGVVYTTGQNSAFNPSAGFTLAGSITGTFGGLYVAYDIVAATTSVAYNPTWTHAAGGTAYSSSIITFSEVSGGMYFRTSSLVNTNVAVRNLGVAKFVQPTSAESVLTQVRLSPGVRTALAQTVSLLKGFPRTISAATTEIVRVGGLTRVKTIFTTLVESITSRRGVGLARGAVEAQVVSSRKTFSGLRTQPSVVQAQAIGLLRSATKVVGVALAESVSAFRNTLGKISVASAEVVNRILIKPKTIQVSSAEFAQAQKGTGQLVGVFSAQVVNLKIRFRFFIHTALAQTANLVNTPAKVLRTANPETVHLLKAGSVQPGVSSPEVVSSLNTISKAFSTSLDEAFSVFVSNTKFVLLSVGQSQSFSLVKTVFKVLQTGLGQTVSSIKNLPKTFSTSLLEAVSKKLQVGKPLSTSLSEHISFLAGLRRITGTTLSQVVLIRKTIFKGIGTTLAQATRALIAKTSTVSVESPQTTSLFSVVGKRISSFLSQSISVGKMQGFNRPVSVHLSQAQSVLARLKVYIRRRQILSIFYKPNSED